MLGSSEKILEHMRELLDLARQTRTEASSLRKEIQELRKDIPKMVDTSTKGFGDYPPERKGWT